MISRLKEWFPPLCAVLVICLFGIAAICGIAWIASLFPWPDGLTEPRCPRA